MGTRVKMAMAVLVATAVMVEGWALRERMRAAALTTRAISLPGIKSSSASPS